MKWKNGCCGGGYRTTCVASSRFPVPWDVCLLHVPPGASINEHVDSVEGKAFRFNIALHMASGGGFDCPEAFIFTKRFKFFRADCMKHWVQPTSKYNRLFLSFGFQLPI